MRFLFIESARYGRKSVMVDSADYFELSKHRWNINPGHATFYATTNLEMPDGSKRQVTMHRLLMGVWDPKVLVDHEDGDGLNNTRENLRICTPTQNQRNRVRQRNNTSGFRGVCYYGGTFHAQITIDNRYVRLGTFKTAEAAAAAYEAKAREVFGEFYRPDGAPRDLTPRSTQTVVDERRLSTRNSSGVKGVSWKKSRQKWVAQLKYGGKNHLLGAFRTIEEAKACYETKRAELRAEGAQVYKTKDHDQ